MDAVDPRIDRLAESLSAHRARRVPRSREHVEAAVALVVRPREELEVLLVERARREADPWSGHVGLPGGRREAGDPDLAATAVRETEEETGIRLADGGRALGFLDEVTPATPRLPPIVIAPLVAVVPADVSVRPNPREVRSATWAPVSALADPAAREGHVVEIDGTPVVFPAIRHGELVVWGLTYRILTTFLVIAEAP